MIQREIKAEQLDDLNLQGQSLHDALKSLHWVNRWFGNHRQTVSAILDLARPVKKPLMLIDLGCGGGDLILAVAKALRRTKILFTITGIDGNAATLAYAKQKCADYPEILFREADILQAGFKTGPCDILFTSHFIYHFTEDGLIRFLRQNLPEIRTAMICSELDRNRMALYLFRIFGSLMPISKMARQDGKLAIKRSFTKKEWQALLNQAELTRYRIKKTPLFRLQVFLFPQQNSGC